MLVRSSTQADVHHDCFSVKHKAHACLFEWAFSTPGAEALHPKPGPVPCRGGNCAGWLMRFMCMQLALSAEYIVE